jgi:hypothetical protein
LDPTIENIIFENGMSLINETTISDSISGLVALSSAVIDASSIIYMHKSSFLHLAAKHIRLHTPDAAIKETGILESFFEIAAPGADTVALSADEQVIELAVRLKIPVISEDKKVLRSVAGTGLSYYNALMILNFLLYKKEITMYHYDKLHAALISVARYSKFVLSYGEMVKKKIFE